MNLFDLVQNQLSDQVMDQLNQKVGGSREQTRMATDGIVSTLLSALSKNAQKPEGAQSLLSALDRDHDGSVLDDAMELLSGNKQASNPRAFNGSGIVRHVLGEKEEPANQMLGKMTGMDTGQISQLMVTLAPLVMGALGKAKKNQQLDAGGLGQLLSHSVQSQTNQRSELGLIGQFLDKDNDGSVMDDLINMGMKAFFRPK